MTIYPQLVFISQIYALFWRAIYRLKNAVAYKKWQISGMAVPMNNVLYNVLYNIENSQLSTNLTAAAAAGSEATCQGLRCSDLWKLVIFNTF